MSVTILDGPNNKNCCFFCSAMNNKEIEKTGLCIYNQIDNIEYCVETIPRYCPRCGKELIPEQKYYKLWNERYKDDPRLFTINSEIATFELIKAMNNSKEKYWDRMINDSQ